MNISDKRRKPYKYTPEIIGFMKENGKNTVTNHELMEIVNKNFGASFTCKQIDNARYRNGFPGDKRKKMRYTPEIIGFMKENRKRVDFNHELMELVNEKFNTSFTIEQIKAARYYKGVLIGKKLRTSYICPLFAETTDKSGNVFIKVSDKHRAKHKNWRRKHLWIWEQAHGKIPKGYTVIFLDGCRTNFEPENLALVTNNELLRMSQFGLWSDDRELTKAGLAVVRHNTAIHETLLQKLGKKEHKNYMDKIYRDKRKTAQRAAT
ncbi:MAG: HNH endonuclease [Treponema sp.]|jgi:hypothetical protein|nr:HNH endonuclease [Treponema sp.]